MGANSYVVKVELEGALRRMTLEGKQGGSNGASDLAFSFAQLEGRVRGLFQLPPAAPIALTYVDGDGDIVTMADDEDLQDALVVQSLNPLRLSATKVGGSGTEFESKSAAPAVAEKVNAAPISEAVPQSEATPMETAPAEAEAKDAEQEKNSSGGKVDVERDESELDKYKDVHYGIRCDNCNTLPIVGTRFKSCSKANYDLCRPCFESTGAEPNDYVTIDRQFYRLVEPTFLGWRGRNPRNLGCRGGMGMRSGRHPACGAAATEAKKDASGTAVEHKGVQCDECGVSPIQGSRFKSATRFNYDVCLACFEKGGSNAAEYIRYDQPIVWSAHPVGPMIGRMFGPIGPMFGYTAIPRCGRRVIVRVGNANVPETAEAEKKAEGMPSGANETGKSGAGLSPTSPSAPVAVEEKSKAKGEAKPSEATEVGSAAAEATAAARENQNALDVKLAEVRQAGFKNDLLNRELLEKNNLDLAKTLKDLSVAAAWVHILRDLQEMGFDDELMNWRLLFKNNGSMKRVVRELVEMEKDKKQA